MNIAVRANREGEKASLVPTGPFDLAHATAIMQAIQSAEASLNGCRSVGVDLVQVEQIDGTGAVLLARLLDRFAACGCRPTVVEDHNPEAARLIALYRGRREDLAATEPKMKGGFAFIGEIASRLPGKAKEALAFTGRCAVAVPQTIVRPNSVDWRSLPRLIQEIGADALVVTGAANLLVGVIIGFLGISQLGRFGALSYVPELVVVAHLRELGPLMTAMVVAGRSGAGLSSEIATMKVSEEIDALRSMGFDPMKWLVVPRCVALVVTLPLLTWVGDVLALVGGFGSAMLLTRMTPRAYVLGTLSAITGSNLLTGLLKSPFLGLAIGVIACGQGLLTQGGAAAVGTRTTIAVVLATVCVILISAGFTLFFVLLGI